MKYGIVVYIHGAKGNYHEADDFLYIKNCNVVGLDYEDGSPWAVGETIKEKFAELIEGYDYVYVIANSIGAFYTYTYLNKFNIKKAFFISPVVSMKSIIIWRMIKEKISKKELAEKKFIKLENGHEFDYEFYKKYVDDNFLETWDVDTEILYPANDEIILYEDVIKFVINHPKCNLTIKTNSSHYLHTDEEKEFIKKWITESLK